MAGASTKRRSTSLTKLPDVRAARRGEKQAFRVFWRQGQRIALLMPRELLVVVRSATERPSAQAHTGLTNPITSQTLIFAPLPAQRQLAPTCKTRAPRVSRDHFDC